ncbi:MAG TPA: O-antigen ligase family protein [Actinomycetota bacterium]|jgi:hypothetical protein
MIDPVGALLIVSIALVTPVVLVGVFGIRRVAFGMLLVAAFTVSMNNLRPTGFMTVSDVALLGALPLVIGRRSAEHRNSWAIAGAAGVITLGGLIGTFFSDDSTESLLGAARFVGASILIALLFARWQPDRRSLRTLAWATVLGTTVNALIGILFIRTYYGRAQGLSFQSNHLGIACLLAAGAALALAVSSGNVRRWSAIGCGLVLSGGVVVSGSRAALVGLAFLGVAALVVSRDRRLIRLAAVGTVGVAVALQAGLIQLPDENAISRLLDPESSTVVFADTVRDTLRDQSVARIKQYPLTGTGFEDALEAHSLYIQTWATAGVVGLFGVAWLAVIGLRMLRWSYRKDRFVSALAVTYVAFMVCAIESNNMWDRFIWLHLILVAAATDHAMAVAAVSDEEAIGQEATALPRRRGRPYGELGRAT